MPIDNAIETKPKIPLWKSVIRRWSIYIIIASAVAMIFGQLGSLSWRFDIACHFVPFYLIATAFATTVLAAIRAWRWACIGGLCVLINLIAMVPCYLPAPNRAPDSTQRNLRILHANIFTPNKQYQALLDYISETDPDIICVQEINQAWVSALSELKERFPHTVIHPRSDNFGISIYSKLKSQKLPTCLSIYQCNILLTHVVQNPKPDYAWIFAEATIADTKVNGNQPEVVPHMQRFICGY